VTRKEDGLNLKCRVCALVIIVKVVVVVVRTRVPALSGEIVVRCIATASNDAIGMIAVPN